MPIAKRKKNSHELQRKFRKVHFGKDITDGGTNMFGIIGKWCKLRKTKSSELYHPSGKSRQGDKHSIKRTESSQQEKNEEIILTKARNVWEIFMHPNWFILA